MSRFEDHVGFLELFVNVSPKVQVNLIKQAKDSEVEILLDCFVNIEPYEHLLRKCKPTLKLFDSAFRKKNFTVKKAKLLFSKHLKVVTAVVSTLLVERLNKELSADLLEC